MALYDDDLKFGECRKVDGDKQIHKTGYISAIYNVRDLELNQGSIVLEDVEQAIGKENVLGLWEIEGYNGRIVPSDRPGYVGGYCCDGNVIGMVVEKVAELSEKEFKECFGDPEKDKKKTEEPSLADHFIKKSEEQHRKTVIMPCNIFVPNCERNRKLLRQLGMQEILMPVLVNDGEKVTFNDPQTKARWDTAIKNAEDGKEKPQTLKLGTPHSCLTNYTKGSTRTMAQRY